MKNLKKSGVALAASCVLAAGCGTNPTTTQVGSVTGAAAGALVGHEIGKRAR